MFVLNGRKIKSETTIFHFLEPFSRHVHSRVSHYINVPKWDRSSATHQCKHFEHDDGFVSKLESTFSSPLHLIAGVLRVGLFEEDSSLTFLGGGPFFLVAGTCDVEIFYPH